MGCGLCVRGVCAGVDVDGCDRDRSDRAWWVGRCLTCLDTHNTRRPISAVHMTTMAAQRRAPALFVLLLLVLLAAAATAFRLPSSTTKPSSAHHHGRRTGALGRAGQRTRRFIWPTPEEEEEMEWPRPLEREAEEMRKRDPSLGALHVFMAWDLGFRMVLSDSPPACRRETRHAWMGC